MPPEVCESLARVTPRNKTAPEKPSGCLLRIKKRKQETARFAEN